MVHWYQFVTVHHVPKCMSCHKDIVVITERAHCFHDYIYITPILLLYNLSSLCVVDHLWHMTTTYIILLAKSLLNTLWFIGTTNVHHRNPLWWYLWGHTVFMITYIYVYIYIYIYIYIVYIYIYIYLYIYIYR